MAAWPQGHGDTPTSCFPIKARYSAFFTYVNHLLCCSPGKYRHHLPPPLRAWHTARVLGGQPCIRVQSVNFSVLGGRGSKVNLGRKDINHAARQLGKTPLQRLKIHTTGSGAINKSPSTPGRGNKEPPPKKNDTTSCTTRIHFTCHNHYRLSFNKSRSFRI